MTEGTKRALSAGLVRVSGGVHAGVLLRTVHFVRASWQWTFPDGRAASTDVINMAQEKTRHRLGCVRAVSCPGCICGVARADIPAKNAEGAMQ